MGLSLKALKGLQRHASLTPRLFKRLRDKEKFLRSRLYLVQALLRKPMQKGEEGK